MPFCSNCGTEVKKETVLCPNCGQSQKRTLEKEEKNPFNVGDIVADKNTEEPYKVIETPDSSNLKVKSQTGEISIMSTDSFDLLFPVKDKDVSDSDPGSIGWALLGICLPIVGLVLFIVWNQDRPKDASAAGLGAIVGFILAVFYFMFIVAQ